MLNPLSRFPAAGLALLAACALLAGCSTPAVGVRLSSTANLNMNEESEPLPVVVRLYQLSQAEDFRAASFDELWRADLATLGNALLVREELVMDPAYTRTVEMPRHDDARYLGVMAVFRSVDGESWKGVQTLPDSWVGRRLADEIRVSLRGSAVVVE